MDRPNRDELDAHVLPGPVAARLLARASEMDAAREAGATIAELRAAAVEAGISPDAFEAALAELRGAQASDVPAVNVPRPRRVRRWNVAAGAAVLATLASIAVARTILPGARVPGLERVAAQESFVLRCLSPIDAASLIRPLLEGGTAEARQSSASPSRVLTVTGTPAQIQRVREVLASHEAVGSTACSAGPPSGSSR